MVDGDDGTAGVGLVLREELQERVLEARQKSDGGGNVD